MTTLPIVFIVDDSYVMPLAVTLQSLKNHFFLKNSSNITGLQIYIIAMCITTDSKDILRSVLFNGNNDALVSHSMEFIPAQDSCPLLTRLKISSYLPTTLSHVLYLDADMLIRANILDLWDITKDTAHVAAVLDVGQASSVASKYFNAGLLVLNLQYMREESFVEKMLAFVQEKQGSAMDESFAWNTSIFPYREQDVLNAMFPDWQRLPFSWNTQGLDSYAMFRTYADEDPDAAVNNTSTTSHPGLFTRAYLHELQEGNAAKIVHFTGSTSVTLSHFNEKYCPMPIKPWSGCLTTIHQLPSNKKDIPQPAVADCISHERKWLPYVQEWYHVLHSIPVYKDWWPDLSAVHASLRSEVDEYIDNAKQEMLLLQNLEMKRIPDIRRNDAEKSKVLAILLPITSRNSDVSVQLQRIQALVQVFPATRTRFYLAIDTDDPIYGIRGRSDAKDKRNELLSCFLDRNVPVTVQDIDPTSSIHHPAICRITNQLAKQAYDDGCFYYLLLGDDIQFHLPSTTATATAADFLPLIEESFHTIMVQHPGVPYGFGCVACHDLSSLGFPTFPIVTRIHMDIFAQQWCPVCFINQDADPYLFELYRAFQCSVFNRKLSLTNNIGGANQEPRYKRHHLLAWKDEVLPKSIEQLQLYMRTQYQLPQFSPCLRLDIIIPSFRVPKDYLERMINLPVPPYMSTTVIIILDSPDAYSYELKAELEAKYEEKVRVRVNQVNRGASYTRSRGLDESCATWILYLDDDVIPSEDLLYVVGEEILQTGDSYAGYVGATYMSPQDTKEMTSYAKAISLVHLLHFWADHVTSGRLLAPWGITAQLVLKRSHLRFNEIFPRTGGGEDIDLCLRTCRLLQLPLKNLPKATCVHPWWNEGRVHISRFLGWATGDSFLLALYPEYCYLSYPNGLEMILFCVLLHVLYIIIGYYGMYAWQNTQQHCLVSSSLLVDTISSGTIPSTTDVSLSTTMLMMMINGLCSLVSMIAATFLLDVGMELQSIMQERHTHLPKLSYWDRLYCGVLGIVLYRICGADRGHVWIPLWQRGSLSHFCVRFDWWCGLYPQEIQNIRARELGRFVVFLLGWALVMLLGRYYFW